MFEMQSNGLDEFNRQFEELNAAIPELSGKSCEVRFDPSNPNQVRIAIEAMENAVDARLSPFFHNPLVHQLADAAKQHFKEQIIKRASQVGTSPSLSGIPLTPPYGSPFAISGCPAIPFDRWNPTRPRNKRK